MARIPTSLNERPGSFNVPFGGPGNVSVPPPAAANVGRVLRQAGEAAARVGRERHEAAARTRIAELDTQLITAAAEAEAAAQQAAPERMVEAFEEEYERRFNLLMTEDEIPAVRDAVTQQFERSAAFGSAEIERASTRRTVEAARASLDNLTATWSRRVAERPELASEAAEDIRANVERLTGRARGLGTAEQAEAYARDAVDAVRFEALAVLVEDQPQTAIERLQGEDFADVPKRVRSKLRDEAERRIAEQDAEAGQEALQAAQRKLDRTLTENDRAIRMMPNQFADHVDHETRRLAELPGIDASPDELKAEFLAPHLRLAASEGLTDRFDVLARALPRGVQADQLVSDQSRVLMARAQDNAVGEYFAQQADAIMEHDHAAMQQGDVTGGSARIDDVTIVAPNGSEQTFSREDRIEAARQREWQRIDQQFPRDDPESAELNLDARLEFMRRNPDVTDPEIEATFSGVHARIPAEAEAAPPSAVQALGLYQHIRQTHAPQLDAHVDERDRAFLRIADAINRHTPATDSQSLMLAAQAERAGGIEAAQGMTGELNKAVQRHTGRLFRDDVANEADVRAELEERARLYVATQRLSVEAAMEAAEADFIEDSQIIAGRWVNVAGKQHTLGAIEDIDTVGRKIIEHHTQQLGDEVADVERDPGSYALVPDTSSNTWYVSWQGNGLPAEGATRYSDADLLTIAETLSGVDREQARREGLERAQKRMAKQRTATRTRLNQIARDVETNVRRVQRRADFDPERFRVPDEPTPDVSVEFPEPPPHLEKILGFIRADETPLERRARTRPIPHQRRPLPASTTPAGGMMP